jgi:hypothetical protein
MSEPRAQEEAQPARPRLGLPRGKVPSWFIAMAVVVTAAITIWAMWQKGAGFSTSEMPMRLAQAASPMYGAVGEQMGRGMHRPGAPGHGPQGPGAPGHGPLQRGALGPQFRVVANNRPVPPIQAGARATHGERGACTLCHVVVDHVGSVIPMISAYSALPHPYRGGLCINCHKVKATAGAGNNNLLPMAAVRPATPAPTEAAWMGMEVAPITPLLASQYKIPDAIQGVAVTEVESTARLAGVQAGDVVVGVNQASVTDMAAFASATENGALRRGTLHLLRGGKFVRVTLPGNARPPAAGNGQVGFGQGLGGRGQRWAPAQRPGGGAWSGAAPGAAPCPTRRF